MRDIAAVLHERVTRLIHEHPRATASDSSERIVSAEHQELLTAISGYDELIQQRLADPVAHHPEGAGGFDEQAWRALLDATEAAEHTAHDLTLQP